MSIDEFFGLLLKELEVCEPLRGYYRFLENSNRFVFRKAYFCQRLRYVEAWVGQDRGQSVWDCGCGYGTTAIFLALNGFDVEGSTLEFYYPQIAKRLTFWSQYGDVSSFRYRYENLFDRRSDKRFDTIILQDTLHHIEPIREGLGILRSSLNANGKLLVVEENGANLWQNLKLFRQRGLNKTTTYFDTELQRNVMMGNENIRSLHRWRHLFAEAGLVVREESVEHIRLLPPPLARRSSEESLIRTEGRLAANFPWLKKYFFFGVNFTAGAA